MAEVNKIKKNKRLKTTFILWFFVFCFFFSCEPNPEPITEEGVITGYVRDEKSNELEGVLVTAFGPYGKRTVKTDIRGYYEFTSIGNGSYYLEFSRNDVGTRRLYNIKIFGDDKYSGSFILYTRPGSFIPPPLTRAFVGNIPRSSPAQSWIGVETAARSNNRDYYNYGFDLILFFSKSENVQWNNYEVIVKDWNGYFWDDPITLYVEPHSLPFQKGQQVYVKAYVANKSEDVNLLDAYTGKPEFSTLDKTRYTNTVSFIMP